jgi:hypothetical protein
MPTHEEFQQQLHSIESMLGEVQSITDPTLRSSLCELFQRVIDVHGTGVGRILELIRARSDGQSIIDRLGRDEIVSSLLVLYGLHPMTLEQRVRLALDKVRSQLNLHNSEVQLASVNDGEVTVRIQLRMRDFGSSNGRATRETIEEAVYQAAPDLACLTVTGGEEDSATDERGPFPLQMVQ